MTGSEFSLGVEEEYQLVDPETGALRSRARDVLALDWGGELYPEVQETMLEVGTRVCADSAGVERELRRLRLHVGAAAAAEELTFAAAGLHPFSRWEAHRPAEGERYRRILDHFGRVMRSEHVFGMHVHVAVPEGVERVGLMNRLRVHLPHLLALSASSPVYEGADTGFASYRAVLVRRLPVSGIPPHFADPEEFDRCQELLLGSGALADRGTVYWSLRPHPRYPTLEFRVTDACPRVEDAATLAALVRSLVAAAVRDRLPDEWREIPPAAAGELLDANEWQAARYGLDAVLVAPGRREGRETARDAVLRLAEQVAPVARALGEGEMPDRVRALVRRGSAAERLRALLRGGAAPVELVRWLAAESQLGLGLDRRTEQRRAAGGTGGAPDRRGATPHRSSHSEGNG